MRAARRKRVRRSRAWLPEMDTQDMGWTVDAWQHEVLSNKTRMGYWGWVREKKKSNYLAECHGDLFAGVKA